MGCRSIDAFASHADHKNAVSAAYRSLSTIYGDSDNSSLPKVFKGAVGEEEYDSDYHRIEIGD
jgi:hypothetical protein